MVGAGIKIAGELPGMAFRLLQRQGNILTVEGFDAIEGTSVAKTKMPPWITSW